MESKIELILFYIAQGFFWARRVGKGAGITQSCIYIFIFFSVIIKLLHLKTWKWLQSIGFQQCTSSKVFFFYQIRLAKESVLLSAPIWSKGLWKKHKNYVQFALWGFRVAESRNGSMWMISWVAVCSQTAGSWLPLGGTLLHMSRLLGSPENSLSRLLWTQENLPEIGFGFQLELAAGLIVLELLLSVPSSKSKVGAWVRRSENMSVLLLRVFAILLHEWRGKNLIWRCLLLIMKIMSMIHWFIMTWYDLDILIPH